MNWLSILLQALTLVAPTIKAVEQLSAPTATGPEKQTAVETIIGEATGVASGFLNPADQAKASVISGLVQQAIPATVAALNASGSMPAKIITAVTQDAAIGGVAAAVATGQIPAEALEPAAAPAATQTKLAVG